MANRYGTCFKNNVFQELLQNTSNYKFKFTLFKFDKWNKVIFARTRLKKFCMRFSNN